MFLNVRGIDIVFTQGRKSDGSANAHAVNVTMKRKYRYVNNKCCCSITAVWHTATGHLLTSFIRRCFIIYLSFSSYPLFVLEFKHQLLGPIAVSALNINPC